MSFNETGGLSKAVLNQYTPVYSRSMACAALLDPQYDRQMVGLGLLQDHLQDLPARNRPSPLLSMVPFWEGLQSECQRKELLTLVNNHDYEDRNSGDERDPGQLWRVRDVC